MKFASQKAVLEKSFTHWGGGGMMAKAVSAAFWLDH